jgi:Uma2 family endonuclease
MTSFTELPQSGTKLPDHTQLPDTDGTFVKNFLEHPQSILLTTAIEPILQMLHPDGQYAIGQDSGIYWRMTDPPERGAAAPDWFYVPNVPPTLAGISRRSYVMWQELVPPLLVLEFVSGDGAEERDRTPWSGKFWVYEQVIRPAFYGIYEVTKAKVDLYHLVDGRYELLPPNQRGHYAIPPMGVELGIWPGQYQNVTVPWLRWWGGNGQLLPTGEERVELAKQQLAQTERQLAQARQETEQAQQRAERLAALLRAQGIDPE